VYRYEREGRHEDRIPGCSERREWVDEMIMKMKMKEE
jgi:hypothetical protein